MDRTLLRRVDSLHNIFILLHVWPSAFLHILSLPSAPLCRMFPLRAVIFPSASALALAVPLRRDSNVAIPFDPVSGDEYHLNLDGNALAMEVSPSVLEYVPALYTFASVLTGTYTRAPDLSNSFCPAIDDEYTGGAELFCTYHLRSCGHMYDVDVRTQSMV